MDKIDNIIKKHKELKDKRDSPEYEEYFLRYRPADKETPVWAANSLKTMKPTKPMKPMKKTRQKKQRRYRKRTSRFF